MSFGHPFALIVLVVVPIAAGLYVVAERRRRAAARPFASPALLPNLVSASPGWRRHLPPTLLGLAVIAFLVGLARRMRTFAKRSNEATAILVIDTSRSMGATDVAPSRLASEQAIAQKFVKGLPGTYRAAIVAFGSRAQITLAPTLDRGAARSSIDQLRVGTATALGDAIALAVKLAAQSAPKQSGEDPPAPAALLVLSDGALDGSRVSLNGAIDRARKAHVPVFTGVVGTADGIVQVKHPEGFVEQIRVPTDPDAMRTLAQGTGGRFYDDPADQDLGAVLEDLAKRRVTVHRHEEITDYFAGGGAALLLTGALLSGVWFRRVV